MEEEINYHGTIYGAIHALYKGGEPMYFQLRAFISDALVRCEFEVNLYKDVVKALERPTGLVYATGLITANRTTREIKAVSLEKIKPAPQLTEEEYGKFFGCAPDITGTLTTEQYIDLARENGKDNS